MTDPTGLVKLVQVPQYEEEKLGHELGVGWLEPGKKEFTKENGGYKRTNMGKFSFPFTAH